MIRFFKKLINKIFFITTYQRSSLYHSLSHIKQLGFNPNTVIDVGVVKGQKIYTKHLQEVSLFL